MPPEDDFYVLHYPCIDWIREGYAERKAYAEKKGFGRKNSRSSAENGPIKGRATDGTNPYKNEQPANDPES